MDLSVIIPARNEPFLRNTVEDVLRNARADTEVIVICDGAWPVEPLLDHPRLTIVHKSKPIGQRAAVNLGAKTSQAKYIMKLDAHCAVDEGFDVKLIADCQPDWVMVPTMYSLHIFDWVCKRCGYRAYQGCRLPACKRCAAPGLEMEMIWKRRKGRKTRTWRFDRELHFQYWQGLARRQTGDLLETMSFIGACMFLERDRFWALGGMDEKHGSWGQFGTEWACKSWLSGGKLISSRRTWFGHLFRCGNFSANGNSSFPYPLPQADIDAARAYSQDLWLNDKWPLARHPLSWLIDKFAPIPDWHGKEEVTAFAKDGTRV